MRQLGSRQLKLPPEQVCMHTFLLCWKLVLAFEFCTIGGVGGGGIGASTDASSGADVGTNVGGDVEATS